MISGIEEVMKNIRKQFGEMAILRLGEEAKKDVPVISTGALSLDLALGVGGLPKGRIIELYGHESSGKTTLALHVVANAQKHGGAAAFIDAEHALDPGYAKKIGVELENLVVSQPNSGEEALTICEQLIRSGAFEVIVVDSVAALTPQAEIDGQMGDSHVGLQARLMSQAMRKLLPRSIRRRRCASSRIRCARRLASCSVIRRPRQAARRLSSTPPVVCRSSVSARSRSRRGRSSATVLASRW